MDIAGIREKALRFYGYGTWASSHWFVGPEEGGDDAAERVVAWRRLGAKDLCDCREFHQLLGEKLPEYLKLHRTSPAPAPPLQFTWRKLMLLFKASRGEPYDNESLRKYQLKRWGHTDGETCVIELSGIPSPDSKRAAALANGLFNKDEFQGLRRDRLSFIVRKLDENCDRPSFFVIYGKAQWEYWERHLNEASRQQMFAGVEARIAKRGQTTIVFAQHPNRERGDSYWIELGNWLREYGDQRRSRWHLTALRSLIR